MKHIFHLSKLDLTNLIKFVFIINFFSLFPTELRERSLIESREAVAKCIPAYFARVKRISVRDYSAYRLFH